MKFCGANLGIVQFVLLCEVKTHFHVKLYYFDNSHPFIFILQNYLTNTNF